MVKMQKFFLQITSRELRYSRAAFTFTLQSLDRVKGGGGVNSRGGSGIRPSDEKGRGR